MAYTIIEPYAVPLPINQTDAGVTFPNASSAAPTPPLAPGMVVRAQDPTYGDGEFILLLGVANTVVGSVVSYNATTYQTVLQTATLAKNAGFPVAVAMSANGAGTWGWYQIGGNAVVKKETIGFNPNVAVFFSATAGRVRSTASAGIQMLGARSANLTTVVTTTSTVVITLDRPHAQGQIT